MEHVWFVAALWLGLALVATLLSIWFRISTALTEIVVGTVAQLILGAAIGSEVLGVKAPWISFLAGTGAIVLTFLAGAELDPSIFRTKWKEAFAVGLVGFIFPFLGATAGAHFLIGWSARSSWLAGIAMSTTSVAVVYAVMLESGFSRTAFGKGILAACFINDLGTVIALGLIFAPFTYRTLIFVGASVMVFLVLPFVTPWFFERFGGRVSELETKYLLFLLFAMGGIAGWAGSESVLPAYLIGMVLAGTVGKDYILIRRLRTLTIGLLTPFYFIRAGSLVSIPALVATPLVLWRFSLPKCSPYGPGLQLHRPRRNVLRSYDVHGIDVRDNLSPVRSQPWHHQPGPVFSLGGDGDRERRHSHGYRQFLFYPKTPLAPSGRCGPSDFKICNPYGRRGKLRAQAQGGMLG